MSLVVLKVRVNFGFETWMFQPKKQPHFESFSSFQSISLWIYGDTIWLITRHYLFFSMDSEWIHRHFRSESDSCALMIRRANNSIPLISIIIIIREYQRWLLFAFSFLHQFSIFDTKNYPAYWTQFDVWSRKYRIFSSHSSLAIEFFSDWFFAGFGRIIMKIHFD